MNNEFILVLDFGGQYNQLIARRVRECGVYCEIHPYNKAIDIINNKKPKGIIFTGGPNSVYSENAPKIDKEVFNLNIPILGICYGAQIMAVSLGGEVKSATIKEFGKTETSFNNDSYLFNNLNEKSITWMSHSDYISKQPQNFIVTASCKGAPIAAMECKERKLYATQFHPEVNHTEQGDKIIRNFLENVCNCHGDWNIKNYSNDLIKQIREEVGNKKVLLALSGGVDSSVLAALMSKAIGKQLTTIFVDHGLLRKNEGNEVEEVFKNWEMNFKRVNCEDYFLNNLKGVTDPEKKRKVVGEGFIRIFEEESKKIGDIDYLAQGTIYPDIIESGLGDSAVIKSHHNVGGLPEKMNFKGIIEPLKMLFKDEVRNLGLTLGLPKELINRQPFPGPGLCIRIIGEVTKEKLNILRDADYIFREEIKKAGVDKNAQQYFAVLTSMRSVGVMGDARTYDYTLALRAVETSDFMTADFSRIPYDVLSTISNRIINEVKGLNRILYDITTKPPATIEFE